MPWMSANGLPGKRVEAYRAGMIPINLCMLEQTVKLGIYLVDNLTEILRSFGEFDGVDVNDEQLSFFGSQDYSKEEFLQTIENFQQRNRRFGGVK